MGGDGNGTLKIEAGGVVSSTSRPTYLTGDVVGMNVRPSYSYPYPPRDTTGVVTVNGAGSQWNNSDDLYIGGRDTEAGGSGILNIRDSGLVTVVDTTKLWDDGTITLDGGTLDTGFLELHRSGTFNMLDGVLRVNSVSGDITIQGGVMASGHSPAVVAINGDYA